jgi:hypothetical protein
MSRSAWAIPTQLSAGPKAASGNSTTVFESALGAAADRFEAAGVGLRAGALARVFFGAVFAFGATLVLALVLEVVLVPVLAVFRTAVLVVVRRPCVDALVRAALAFGPAAVLARLWVVLAVFWTAFRVAVLDFAFAVVFVFVFVAAALFVPVLDAVRAVRFAAVFLAVALRLAAVFFVAVLLLAAVLRLAAVFFVAAFDAVLRFAAPALGAALRLVSAVAAAVVFRLALVLAFVLAAVFLRAIAMIRIPHLLSQSRTGPPPGHVPLRLSADTSKATPLRGG